MSISRWPGDETGSGRGGSAGGAGTRRRAAGSGRIDHSTGERDRGTGAETGNGDDQWIEKKGRLPVTVVKTEKIARDREIAARKKRTTEVPENAARTGKIARARVNEAETKKIAGAPVSEVETKRFGGARVSEAEAKRIARGPAIGAMTSTVKIQDRQATTGLVIEMRIRHVRDPKIAAETTIETAARIKVAAPRTEGINPEIAVGMILVGPIGGRPTRRKVKRIGIVAGAAMRGMAAIGRRKRTAENTRRRCRHELNENLAPVARAARNATRTRRKAEEAEVSVKSMNGTIRSQEIILTRRN